MRIALIAPPWVPVPPPGYGGTEAALDQLARGFLEFGHDVLLFTTGDSTCPVPRQWVLPEAEGIRMGSVIPELRHVAHAYEAVQGYDIVHDHTISGLFYAQQFPELAVVTTNHGPFNDELSDLYRRLADRVPIIAISHSQAAAARSVPVARVIHHGLDLGSFPFGDGGGGHLLFLGRMAPEKGAHRAVEVARAAGTPLMLAAKMREDPEREYFDAKVRPLLGRGIEYAGEVSHEEKLALLAGARALLNPIRWTEPFGLVMIEALACGTPVLSFPEGAAPEIVEHGVTGFLCEDEASMVAAVGRIDELNRADCRASVEARFSTRRMVTDHVALFEELLHEGVIPPQVRARRSGPFEGYATTSRAGRTSPVEAGSA